jgi:hypothetical protein
MIALSTFPNSSLIFCVSKIKEYLVDLRKDQEVWLSIFLSFAFGIDL